MVDSSESGRFYLSQSHHSLSIISAYCLVVFHCPTSLSAYQGVFVHCLNLRACDAQSVLLTLVGLLIAVTFSQHESLLIINFFSSYQGHYCHFPWRFQPRCKFFSGYACWRKILRDGIVVALEPLLSNYIWYAS